MKISSAALLAAVGTVLAIAMPSSAGAATPSPSPSPSSTASTSDTAATFASLDDADLTSKIEKHIGKYGGERKGANQIVWEKQGVTVTFPAPAQAADDDVTYARIHCAYGNYCLYQHALYDREGGAMIAFYNCSTYRLSDYGWMDIASALENNQSGGAVGILYDDRGHYWETLNHSRAWYKADGLGIGNDRANYAEVCP